MNRAAAPAPAAAVLSVSEPREKVRDIHEIRTAPSPQLTFATCTHEQERRGAWKWSHSHLAFYVPPIMAILRKAARWRLVVIIISPERSFIPFIPFLSKLLNLWPLGFSLRPFYPLFIHSHTMAKVKKNINCQMTNLNFRAKKVSVNA